MSGPSREFLMAVEESSYGTAVASPTIWTTSTTYGLANAQAYYARLPGDDQFTMRMEPTGQVYVPYGGGVATDAFVACDKQVCQGQLTIHLSIGQAPFWLSLCGVKLTSAGTVPWTYGSGTVNDLASVSIYHGIIEFDGTVKRALYPGCKVEAWQLSCSESSTIATLTMHLRGQKVTGNSFDSSSDPSAGTFPVPSDNNLPVDPYEWIHTSGEVTIGGTARTAITELNISCNNTLAYSYYNSRYIQYLLMTGRKMAIASKLQYVSAVNDRQNYYTLATEALSVGFSNGTHSLTVGCNSTNVYDPLKDNLPLASTYWQSMTSKNMWDVVAGSDFTLAFT
jgi:Phage tail tube protein